MKTDLLTLAGAMLLLAAMPMVSYAGEDDWITRSPLADGQSMDACDTHHHDTVLAIEPAPPLAAEKLDAILATPDVVPVTASVATPAVATVPTKAPRQTTMQASPRHLSTAALLTFALIASPGTALPQTNAGGRD